MGKTKGKLIYIILFFAFLVRLIGLNQSLWLDEAIGAIAAKNFTYTHLLTNFLKVDNHPPLYYLLLKFWTRIFGYSEISLRMPSVLFGVATIYVVYLIARKISQRRYIAYLAASFLSFSSFFIYYSQEARMYAMAAFFAALAFYAFIKLLEKSENVWWAVFSASLTFLVFTDYMPIFLLPVFWIWSMYAKRTDHKWISKFVVSHLPIVGIGIFWLPIFLAQKEGGAWLLATVPNWRKIAGGANLKEIILVWTKFVFGRISLVNKKMYYLLIFGASIPVVLSLLKALKPKRNVIVWMWFIIPMLGGLFASIFFPAFIYFRYLYIVPAFYLLIAMGIFGYKNKKVEAILIGLIIIFNILSWFIYIKDRTQQREEWRQATEYVESKGNKDNIALFEYPDPFAPYRWYMKGRIEARGVLDSIIVMDSNKVKSLVDDAVRNKKEVYHFEYLRDLSDQQRLVEERLRQDGFVVDSQNGDFVGVGIITKWVRR
ncbi:MAG TPA: glycosyltransferase family 39 protein [Patescibacteria group bacterium]